MAAKVALLLDGGFIKKKLEARNGRFPTAADILQLTRRVMSHGRFTGCDLFRVYYYDAPPLSGQENNPLGGKPYSFSNHPTHARNKQLQGDLSRLEDFAVRRGETVFQGWKLRKATIESLKLNPRALAATDFAPDIEQKGVDLRIGLDVAWLSVRRIVDVITLVSGDSDFVPALKFARREGLKVYLDTMGHGVRPALVEHADCVFNSFELAIPGEESSTPAVV